MKKPTVVAIFNSSFLCTAFDFLLFEIVLSYLPRPELVPVFVVIEEKAVASEAAMEEDVEFPLDTLLETLDLNTVLPRPMCT